MGLVDETEVLGHGATAQEEAEYKKRAQKRSQQLYSLSARLNFTLLLHMID